MASNIKAENGLLGSTVLPSVALLRRTIDIDIAYTLTRLRVLERLEGNPVGIAYRRFGQRGYALMAQYLPVASFNRIVGLEPGDESGLAAMLQWYRAHEVRPQIELVPGLADAAMAHELSRLGFAPSAYHAALIAVPRGAPPPARGVDVERVRNPQTFDDFLNAYCAGWGIPQRDQFKRNVRPWLNEPGWSLFLGRADGKPAAEGILYVRDGTAYLADASTDPAFRGRGLHAALLNARLAAAAEQGADVAVSGAAFLSASHRNMERADMRLQFARSLWTQV